MPKYCKILCEFVPILWIQTPSYIGH